MRRFFLLGLHACRRLGFHLESWLALLLIGVGGAWALCVVPPGATFDAPGHHFRALQVSVGVWRAEMYSATQLGGTLPKGHVEFLNGIWRQYWGIHRFGAESDWREWGEKTAAMEGDAKVEFTNIAVYSPANYLGPAAGMRVAGWLTRSPYWAHRCGEAVNWLTYLAGAVLTLQWLPRFRPGALLLLSSPLYVVQSASLGADAVNFVWPLLWLALVWRLREGRRKPRRVEWSALIGLSLLIPLLKPPFVLVLGAWALLPDQVFGSRLRRIFVVLGFGGLSAALWCSWNFPYLNVDIARWFEPSRIPMAEHRIWVAQHWPAFMNAWAQVLRYYMWKQWTECYFHVGGWGQRAFGLSLTVASYVTAAAAVAANPREGKRDLLWAGWSAAFAFGLVSLVCFTLWTTYGQPGDDTIRGLQGRYFMLVYVAVGIVVAELLGGSFHAVRRWLLGAGLFANVCGISFILWHIPSGSFVW